MLNTPMDILTRFPIRKTGEQKQAFRDAVQAYAQELGYTVTIEQPKKKCNNIIIGDPKSAKYLVTAHYDTPANMVIPNLITPTNLIWFILWQVVVTVVILGAAMIPVLLLVLAGLNPEHASLFWLLSLYGLLGLMMFGPANQNNANDNTSGVVTVLEIARTLDPALRDRVCFVLFDLEEAGLVGSAAYRKAHKAESENQIVLNLDCVGDGDHIVMFPCKKVKKDPELMKKLKFVGGWFGQKNISVHEKGFSYYPSDQKHFPLGVGIAAFHKKKGVGLICSKIHTKKDTTLETTNVNLLRAALTTLISGDAAK